MMSTEKWSKVHITASTMSNTAQ